MSVLNRHIPPGPATAGVIEVVSTCITILLWWGAGATYTSLVRFEQAV